MKKHILFFTSLFLVLGATVASAQENNLPLEKHNNHYHYSRQLLPENNQAPAPVVATDNNAAVADMDIDVRFKLSAGVNAINFLNDAGFWLQGQNLTDQHLSVNHLFFGNSEKHQAFPALGLSALLADGAEVGLQVIRNKFAGQDFDLSYFALDLFGKYTFLQENLLSPYAKISYGRSSITKSTNGYAFGSNLSREVSPTFAFGAGVELNFTYDFGLYFDLSYRNAWEKFAQNHLVQTLGLFYKF